MKLVFACALLCSLALSAFAHPSGLRVSVQPFSAKFDAKSGSGFFVDVKLENPTDEVLYVLKFRTPLYGFLTSDVFEIVDSFGNPATYTGMLVKWADPTEESYQSIYPGQTISQVIDISKAYHLSSSGVHKIAYKGLAHVGKAEMAKKRSLLEFAMLISEPAQFEVLNPLPRIIGTPFAIFNESLVGATIGYDSTCTSSDKSSLPGVISTAASMSSSSLSYLNAQSCTGPYVTWFGTYDATRYSTVKSHFSKIASQLSSGTMKIACHDPQCPANTYAFVYPTDSSYTIHLCGAFWSAPSGAYREDSQPGTIIHETSHFNTMGGTRDYQYGSSGAKSLAKSNPSQAIMNADNHEYFSENNPRC
eukprot:Colp12_sorted_trinity150504_noHs@260